MRKVILLVLTLLYTYFLHAQGTEVPLGNDAYHIMDRIKIKTGIASPFHSSLKFYTRGDVAKYALMMDTASVFISSKDRVDLYWVYKDNNEWLDVLDIPTTIIGGKNQRMHEKVYIDSTKTFYTLEKRRDYVNVEESDKYIYTKKPILNTFYKTPANLFELNQPYFKLRINPIINFKISKEQNEEELNFFNQRGLRLRGVVDDRIWFSANILETQARFPNYVTDRVQRDNAVPGGSFFKDFESSVFNITNGYDFLNGQGHIGFNLTPHFQFQFGHGQHFIGNGYRSLILSDFATNYLYMKFNWRLGRFQYQNLYAELSAEGNRDRKSDNLLGKKYMATHHLSVDILPNLNVGLFETVVFSRNNNFELQYLNPIILYRVVEQMIGSADNVLAGVDVRWDFLKRFSLYGQFVLDEFKFDELFSEGNDWWGNKWAVQAGLKYIDVAGIDHLDAQVEFNMARPFIYTHRDSSSNYAHYNQALAHPLGANFKEYIFKLRYQPIKKLTIDTRVIYADYGEDDDNNYGNNILLPNVTRLGNYGHQLGQGVATKQLLAGLDASYQIWHNTYIELHYLYRKKDSELDARSSTTNFIGGGVRMNIGNRNNDF